MVWSSHYFNIDLPLCKFDRYLGATRGELSLFQGLDYTAFLFVISKNVSRILF